jgi:dTDP-4-amino-4,6-dideoxygalactose transaminase
VHPFLSVNLITFDQKKEWRMVPFFSLREQYQSIKSELDDAIARVLASTSFVLGPEAEAFEMEFAAYCGVRHAVAVNSGTSALHLALLAAGIGKGDEVITTPMTFVATTAAILYAGATPVFVDIDPRTGNIDVGRIEAAVTSRTKAILPVHLHGLMADMDRITNIARRHGLVVIEDAAQAHGAEYRGRRSGSIGDVGCFSFYPAKNLGAFGEGGALVTDNADIAISAKRLRDWGQASKYNHLVHGYNYRMDAVQAAVLRVKLPHLEAWTRMRRAHAALYDSLLPTRGELQTPARLEETHRHVYHVYAVRLARRDTARQQLEAAGIASGMHYPVPVHRQPAYRGLGYAAGAFPAAERFANETLSLPMYPELSREQVAYVASQLEDLSAEVAA